MIEREDYLNLKIGDIKKYSMIVKQENLPYWNTFNWKEFPEIEWPRLDEQTRTLYRLLKTRLETLIFNRPIFLKESKKEKLIGRKISGFSSQLGAYGLGSACFFGLLLDNEEYLVYSVWYASHYILVNGRIVECAENCYDKMRPWISDFFESVWDDLTDYIVGSTITEYKIEDDQLILISEKDQKSIEIKFVRNDEKIPRKTGRFRNAYKNGTIDDYLFFQHKDATLIV